MLGFFIKFNITCLKISGGNEHCLWNRGVQKSPVASRKLGGEPGGNVCRLEAIPGYVLKIRRLLMGSGRWNGRLGWKSGSAVHDGLEYLIT
jgi:hypothetical protein